MKNIVAQNQTGKIVINDFSKMNLAAKNNALHPACAKLYNFDNTNKVLDVGLGIRDLLVYMENDINSKTYVLNYASLGLEYINKVMYFKQYFASSGDTTHRLLLHGSDGKIYLYQMFSGANMLNWTYQLTFSTEPIVLEYKKDGLDSILISANDKLVVWKTGRAPYELTNVPTITSMCVYNDVLYCTIAGERDKIWYTENLDPESVGTESDGTKYLLLSDNCGGGARVVTFKENVYVFRDYGISRLNTYAKNGPLYNQLYLSDSKIYANTVTVCGDFVVFITRDGIYKFNGATVTKVDALPNYVINNINDNAVATNLQDTYYLALNIDFGDNEQVGCEANAEMKNNALIKLNLQDYSFQIMRGVDIKNMLTLKAEFEEKIIVTFNSLYKDRIGEITNDGKLFDEVLPKNYYSNYVIQDDIDDVTLRKIIVDASKDIELKVITDNKEYVFNTYCDGINNFQSIIPCKKFKFAINSSAEFAHVNLIQFEYIKRK